MSINKPDIAQIQKYLNGELDAKAMHSLEKQAQDDPFLMDALEGYQAIGKNQQANRAELQGRFNQRTTQRNDKRNIVLWRVLPVAASVLIALSIGLLWLSPNHPEKQSVAKIIPALSKARTIEKSDPTVTQPAIEQTAVVTQPSAIEAKKVKAHSNITLNRPIAKTENVNPATNNTSIENALANKASSLDITEKANAPVITPASKTITGNVTDPTGHALAGVKISVKGTQLNAVTDTNGVFKITSPAQGTLSLAYAGFDTKQVNITGKDSIKVALNETENELAEVSVPGYVDDQQVRPSRPIIGWKAFSDYIRKNAFMPNGETGHVKLAFTVNASGHINGIRIIRGKSDAMNQKAIELVLNGPGWKGVNYTKELKLKIRFRRYKVTG